MEKEDILTLLKTDLNFLTLDEAKERELGHLIDAAKEFAEQEGVKFFTPHSAGDAQILVMYAGYLYRKRATGEPMPRALRWTLNNRIFAQKAGGGNDV